MTDNLFKGVTEEKYSKRERRPRRELDMPQLRFHHMDTWVPVLGLEVFAAWLKLYTLCDRKTYPKDNIVQHKALPKIAVEFGCGKDKALAILKKLYEYGLIDIIQTRNSKGGVKNHYYWYDIPIYANTTYCELKKCRSWDDTAWEGKQLIEIRLARQEQQRRFAKEQAEKNLLSAQENNQSEKPIGYQSENQIGCQSEKPIGSETDPIGKSDWQPIGKSAYTNNTNISNRLEDIEEDKKNSEQIFADGNSKPSEEQLAVKEVSEYFFGKIEHDPEIIPFIQSWIKKTNKDTVIYLINRMIEQESIDNVILWMEKAINNPEKYPKKISYRRKEDKKKNLMRSMYS